MSTFTMAEKIEFVLLRGSNHTTYQEVADTFHLQHPDRPIPSRKQVNFSLQLLIILVDLA